MPVIKGTKLDGQNSTQVIREESRESTIEEMKKDGYENIHDAETGEKYN